MNDLPPTLMTFPSLDQAESALDWIGVEFADGDGCFEGTLAPDELDLLDAALADHDSPEPVRTLAVAMRALLTAAGELDATGAADGQASAVGRGHAPALAWRVAFTA
ncbi:MAG TPA: hypothetical protein VIK13_16265 [Candidatus Limnocylindrales bacterium]